jgi:hypothetical protein
MPSSLIPLAIGLATLVLAALAWAPFAFWRLLADANRQRLIAAEQARRSSAEAELVRQRPDRQTGSGRVTH